MRETENRALTIHGSNDPRVKRIKAHSAMGEAAVEKGDQHYFSSGILLAKLKEDYRGVDWDALVKKVVGIGRSRADELIRIIAVEKVRGTKRKSVAASKAKLKRHK